MEFCFNPGCSWPNQMAERSKMFYCTRWYTTNYCSIECQKADWKRLKVDCDVFGKSIKEATYCTQRRQAKHNDSQLLLHKRHGIFLTLLKTVVRWKKHLRREARKAAKEAKAKEEESQAVVVNQRQWRPLELMMMRLQIDSAAPITCHHGLVPLSSAYEETEVQYTDVYSSKLESAVSILLASETQFILDGDNHSALEEVLMLIPPSPRATFDEGFLCTQIWAVSA
eukprot:scaffold4786_cov142-Skeletonema_dohrnii-CCMP3373.AAC.4